MVMDIVKAHNAGKVRFAISGRLDTTTAPRLQETLMPEIDAGNNIELDCTELAYISSAGLRVLLLGEKTAQGKGVHMTLAHVSPDIMEIFSMTGFDTILTIERGK